MLVITVGREEAFWVGQSRIVVLGIRNGNRVRLGIEAPREVTVVRENAINKQPRRKECGHGGSAECDPGGGVHPHRAGDGGDDQ